MKSAGSQTTVEKGSGAHARKTNTERDLCNFLLGVAGILQHWQITLKLFIFFHLGNKSLGLSPPTNLPFFLIVMKVNGSHHYQLRRLTACTAGTGNLQDLIA